MKNKPLIYFLLILAAGVWGLILFRVFVATGKDNDALTIAAWKVSRSPLDSFEIGKDTTRLMLNYRDPFSTVKNDDTLIKHLKKIALKYPISGKATVFNWSFIAYSGYIQNRSSKKFIALVSINGQSETLGEGETKQKVKLIRNLRDSIQISYGGKSKFIHLRPALL